MIAYHNIFEILKFQINISYAVVFQLLGSLVHFSLQMQMKKFVIIFLSASFLIL